MQIQIILQRINYMSNMQQCRNGPGCYFLSQGSCWFYHPPWHGPNIQPLLYSYLHRGPTDNVEMAHNENNYEEQEQSVMNSQEAVSMNDSNQDWINQRNLSSNINESNMNNQEDDLPRIAIIKGKQIQLQQIQCQLPLNKRWHFTHIPHYEYFPQIGQQECSICLSKFNDQKLITSLFCKHDFHHRCIQKWLETSNQCPLCRIDFRKHKQFEKFPAFKWHEVYSEDQDDFSDQLDVEEANSNYSYNSGDYDDYDQYEYDGFDPDLDIDYQF